MIYSIRKAIGKVYKAVVSYFSMPEEYVEEVCYEEYEYEYMAAEEPIVVEENDYSHLEEEVSRIKEVISKRKAEQEKAEKEKIKKWKENNKQVDKYFNNKYNKVIEAL